LKILELSYNVNLEINSLLPLIRLEHRNNRKIDIKIIDNVYLIYDLIILRKNISKHSMVKNARKR
jgi:hypothetical protein